MTLILEAAGLAALHLAIAVPLLIWGDRENTYYNDQEQP